MKLGCKLSLSFASFGITGEISILGPISNESWMSILYMAFCCTALCFFFQTKGQQYTPPMTAAIVLTLESVFGVILSAIFYGEEFTTQMIIGFVLIFFAVILAETKFSFLRKKKEV